MNAMKIAGIYPQRSVKQNITIRNTFGEPIGIERILAVADSQGFETKLFIPYEKSIEEQIENIAEFKPDICAFSLLTCQYDDGVYIALKLKEKFPNLITIAGGDHSSAVKFVQKPFDFFVIGEGEATFQEILNEIIGEKNFDKVRGISYWNTDTKSVITQPKSRIANLDAFPTATRDTTVLELSKYYGVIYPSPSQQKRHAYVEFARGCRNKCFFCTKDSLWGKDIVYRSSEKTVLEMIKLKEEFDVNLFFFTDFNFTADFSQVLELCREMAKQNVRTNWFCMSNIETVNEEALNAMKETGCCKIMYGVESVDDLSLKKVRKPTNFDKIQEVLEMTFKIGLLNHIFYMVGFPWDTEESILKQIPKLRSLPGHQIRIGVATPFPGSQWFNEIGKEELYTDYRLFDSEHLVYRHPTLTPEKVKMLVEEIFRSFYKNKTYVDLVKYTIHRFPIYSKSFDEYFELLPLDIKDYLKKNSQNYCNHKV